jgi:PKD domain
MRFLHQIAVFSIAVVVAACGGGGSSSGTPAVPPTNTAPVANAGSSQNVLAGASVVLNGSGSTDVNGNPLNYSWNLVSKPVGSAATLSGNASAAPSFTADLPGTYVASLVVNDGIANSAPVTVTVIGTTGNAVPIANAGVAQSVIAGAVVTLNGGGSFDANGDPLTYSWSLVSKPAGSSAFIALPTSAAPTFAADATGIYVASLVVNDGTVNSLSTSVTVTSAAGNVVPTANAGAAQSVVAGTVVTLNGSASSDANGDPLTYLWSITSRPAGSSAALAGATTVAPNFTPDVVGVYVARLVVNDGASTSAPSTATITSTSAALVCPGGNGNGTNGVMLYTPNNVFSYQLSTTLAGAPDVVTLGWGAAYLGVNGAFTGSLRANLWAVQSSYSGGTIFGTVLGDFPPNFTGVGAFSSSQIWGGSYSTNTISSSAVRFNPAGGQYCLVMTLSEYRPGQCFPSPDGYCIVDWLQFSSPVIFH